MDIIRILTVKSDTKGIGENRTGLVEMVLMRSLKMESSEKMEKSVESSLP